MRLDDDLDGAVGPLDELAMEQIRAEFRPLDTLVERASFDSVLDPTTLTVRFSDGLGDADACRLDIRWYRGGYYSSSRRKPTALAVG
jgi:hypothetical protein